MGEKHFIIIGNGPAGNQAALTLRENATDSRITLISRHPGGCYRPHLLPHMISGRISEEEIYVYSPSSYKEKNIKLRCGQEAVKLDLDNREIILDHKEVLPFQGLIIAVGGKPRIPEQLSKFRHLMLTLKTVENARVWVERLNQVDNVLVIGGDRTSFAFTKALLSMNKKVYFALTTDAFWPLRLDHTQMAEVAQNLTKKGVEVLQSSHIKGMARRPDGTIDVEIEDKNIRVGLMGAFYGLVPDIGFLDQSGLRIDRGILVDEFLSTGFEGIYATGDCAQIYHPDIRDYWVSIGHDNAVNLGRIAAQNLTGARVRAEVTADSIFEVEGIKVNTSWWTEY